MSSAEARVLELIAAARRIADPRDELGREARSVLPLATGLSREGVELALSSCLEVKPSRAELALLLRSVTAAPAAHVLLSANVFVAAHRAIALALAASERVFVRPSRREPHMAELLLRGAPGLFQLSSNLQPQAGHHLFAYGHDETLESVEASLAPGVTFHPHGAGFAVAVVGPQARPDSVSAKLALDIALFDQRGCLNPRVLIVVGADPRPYALSLARSLADLEQRVPLGKLDAEERAAVVRYRESMTYSAELVAAGAGYVSVGGPPGLVVAPVGRNCHVLRADDPTGLLAPQRANLTAVGLEGAEPEREKLKSALPSARLLPLGALQSPPFDGPVDLRQR